MRKRTRARILAMNVLFQMEVGKQQLNIALANVLCEEKDEEILAFVKQNVRECHKNLDKIDELLKNLLDSYKMDRVQNVEKTILRLAIYELFYRQDIPDRVVINEAINQAKQFGDLESGKFVNGVLATALKIKLEKEHEKTC